MLIPLLPLVDNLPARGKFIQFRRLQLGGNGEHQGEREHCVRPAKPSSVLTNVHGSEVSPVVEDHAIEAGPFDINRVMHPSP